jgi:hypothetical protein
MYQLMSEQAQFWEDSWETGPSAARTPIWGESYGRFEPPRAAHDQYLPYLPVPSTPLLRVDSDWAAGNERRLSLAGEYLAQNDELLDLIRMAMGTAEFNRYNLEVFLSIANLYRQNLVMLQDLGRINTSLKQAQSAAGKGDAEKAIAGLDLALNIAESVRQYRNRVLQDATDTWYKSWFPRVTEANGRRYLHLVDDVKDHQPNRTVDMSYLVYRELLYPLSTWEKRVIAVRNEYASAHGHPARALAADWSDTGVAASGTVAAERSSK